MGGDGLLMFNPTFNDAQETIATNGATMGCDSVPHGVARGRGARPGDDRLDPHRLDRAARPAPSLGDRHASRDRRCGGGREADGGAADANAVARLQRAPSGLRRFAHRVVSGLRDGIGGGGSIAGAARLSTVLRAQRPRGERLIERRCPAWAEDRISKPRPRGIQLLPLAATTANRAAPARNWSFM